MRLSLLMLLSVLLCLPLSAQQPEQLEVAIYFETASADLTPASEQNLNSLSKQIQGMGDYRLELRAHTDSRGTSSYNDQLAQRRARSVARFLQTQGVTTDNLQTLALGESLAGNDLDDENRQQENRRVDILIQGWYWQGVGSLQDSLANPLVQRYTLDPNADQLIEGEKGGRFFVSANSFVTFDGQEINGPVTVELTECYSLGDMISLGLTTTAQDRLLESGGMLRLTATSLDGKPLTLKDGRSIGAAVPTPEFQQDMSLFYGQAHGENEGELDWVDTEAPVQAQLPSLRMAPAPSRPMWIIYGQRFLAAYDYENDPRRPIEPDVRKPIRPREPNYEKVFYHPKGLQKIFMSNAKQDQLTAEKREERRERYVQNIERYEHRTNEYYRLWEKYRADAENYAVMIAKEVDERGFLIDGPNYLVNKAKADEAFEQAMVQYRVDSIRYEKYRAYKMDEYERQMESLGIVDEKSLGTYFFNLNRMGWANIDRFLKETETTILAAKEEGENTASGAMVFLMIPERNIILRMSYYEASGYILRRVPVGEKAKILALKVEDQKAYMASQEVIVTDDLILALDYKPGRLRDIRAALEAI